MNGSDFSATNVVTSLAETKLPKMPDMPTTNVSQSGRHSRSTRLSWLKLWKISAVPAWNSYQTPDVHANNDYLAKTAYAGFHAFKLKRFAVSP